MSKKKYYIKVTTFSNTTELGKIIAQQVRATYNKSVVTSGREVERIIEYIRTIQNEALAVNPNMKRMVIQRHTSETYFAINMVTGNYDNDKMAFYLYGEIIEHEYCEEGGEL